MHVIEFDQKYLHNLTHDYLMRNVNGGSCIFAQRYVMSTLGAAEENREQIKI